MASLAKRVFVFGGGVASSLFLFNAVDRRFYEKRESKHTLQAEGSMTKNHDLQLKEVIILTRHGARTPFRFIPNYEPATWPLEDLADLEHTLINYTVKSLDFGSKPESTIDNAHGSRARLKGGSPVAQLTKIGQEQMFQLGRSYRKKYIEELGFLSPEYNNEELYVRSTNMKRTISSARCVLSGLYGSTKPNDPIPIFTTESENEALFPNFFFCANLKQWSKVAMTTWDEIPGLAEFYDAVAKELGVDRKKEEFSVLGLKENMGSRAAKDAPIPECLIKRKDEIESFAVAYQMRVLVGTGKSKEISRMSVGGFMEAMCSQIEDKVRHKSDLKFVLYSGHDMTMMTMLYVLGVYDFKWPKYAADVKIELYQDKNQDWFVKLLYNDKDLTLPGCGTPVCPLSRFLELCEPYRVKDWYAECGIKGEGVKENVPTGIM
ncbi:lysophosphatidic acid phosphatase type 6-like [Rhopilema esculentum]|uniref:lysophosphatidic acid phosphatase type 6-like n=1 Tax=Rhopilema esculentum TaxID=499914 RepID=UPI0031E0C20E